MPEVAQTTPQEPLEKVDNRPGLVDDIKSRRDSIVPEFVREAWVNVNESSQDIANMSRAEIAVALGGAAGMTAVASMGMVV